MRHEGHSGGRVPPTDPREAKEQRAEEESRKRISEGALSDASGKVAPATNQGWRVLGWTREEPAQLNVPFPDALGLASLNGPALMKLPKPLRGLGPTPGQGCTLPEVVPANTHVRWDPNPHQGGRAGPRGPEIMLCSRRHRLSKGHNKAGTWDLLRKGL